MLTTYRHTVGHEVRDTEDGTVVGVVQGLLVDAGHHKISAVIVAERWSAQLRAIRLEAVHSFGREAIMVDPRLMRQAGDTLVLLKRFQTEGPILGKRIITRKGEELGAVEDLYFDAFTGHIQLVMVDVGLLDKLAHGKACLVADFIRAIGPDHVIASGDAADALIREHGTLDRVMARLRGLFRARTPDDADGDDALPEPRAGRDDSRENHSSV